VLANNLGLAAPAGRSGARTHRRYGPAVAGQAQPFAAKRFGTLAVKDRRFGRKAKVSTGRRRLPHQLPKRPGHPSEPGELIPREVIVRNKEPGKIRPGCAILLVDIVASKRHQAPKRRAIEPGHEPTGVGFIQIGASAIGPQSYIMRHRSDERRLPPDTLNPTTGSGKTIAEKMDVHVDRVHGYEVGVTGCRLTVHRSPFGVRGSMG
jgi:hypothetical protein